MNDALAANEYPSPRRIERMATTAGVELAASTVAGWCDAWSVVPAWEKVDALIKALVAEHDEDWRSLYTAALIADRQRKRQERRRKKLRRVAAPVISKTMATDGQPDPQPPHDNHVSTTAQVAVPAADETLDVAFPAPAAGVPAAVRDCNIYGDLQLHPAPAEPTSVAESVPRQLPVKVAHFTGRGVELAKLDILTHDEAAQPATMVISAIADTAGVGKTALVVHWAHWVQAVITSDQHPDHAHGSPAVASHDFAERLDREGLCYRPPDCHVVLPALYGMTKPVT